MPQIYQNPGARSLEADGAVFPVILTGPAGQVQTYALVDSGSSISSVDTSLLQQVGALGGVSEPVDTVSATPIMLQEDSGVALYAP